jgi:chromate reductase
MKTPKILAFAASTRTNSLNRKLILLGAEELKKAGAEVTLIQLEDFELPIYDGDVEENVGVPENGKKLKALLRSHDGFLIASPEYNSAISPLLKNVIDWASRVTEESEPPLCAYRGKVVGLLSVSPGAFGGLRGLMTVRSIFGNIGSIVIPDQLAVPKAHEAFDTEGRLKDPALQKGLHRVTTELVRITRGIQG